MRFEKTREVLEHARDFHRQVSEFYDRLAQQAANKKVKMMLNYMSRHEKGLEDGITRYMQESPREVLEAWFAFTHDETLLEALRNDKIYGSDISLDDVIALAMKFDRYLMDLYRGMANTAATQAVSDMFVSLLELEKQERLKVARNAMMTLDI